VRTVSSDEFIFNVFVDLDLFLSQYIDLWMGVCERQEARLSLG